MLLQAKFIFIVVALLLFFPLASQAQLEGNPVNWCRNGAFPRETNDFKLAKIKARKGEKVYFYKDYDEECPSGASCRAKSYLIAGDEVIVSRTYENFVCAWYEPKKGYETVGWIKAENLETYSPNANPEQEEWFGSWKKLDASINIKGDKKKVSLSITGDALWRGLGDNIHMGEIDFRGTPQNNILNLGEDGQEYDCKVTLRLIGKFLVVSDNLQCGGVNVTFTGVYQKNSSKNEP